MKNKETDFEINTGGFIIIFIFIIIILMILKG